MFTKIVITGLFAAILAAGNANVLASTNDVDKTRPSTAPAAEKKDWRVIAGKVEAKVFDPTSRKSTMSEYNQAQKANKKFSTTSKALIGIGAAAAVVAIVFVVARKDLKDDILR